jgi:hypothetical protein
MDNGLGWQKALPQVSRTRDAFLREDKERKN